MGWCSHHDHPCDIICQSCFSPSTKGLMSGVCSQCPMAWGAQNQQSPLGQQVHCQSQPSGQSLHERTMANDQPLHQGFVENCEIPACGDDPPHKVTSIPIGTSWGSEHHMDSWVHSVLCLISSIFLCQAPLAWNMVTCSMKPCGLGELLPWQWSTTLCLHWRDRWTWIPTKFFPSPQLMIASSLLVIVCPYSLLNCSSGILIQHVYTFHISIKHSLYTVD